MEAGVYDTVRNRPQPGNVTVGNYSTITAFQYDHGNPAIVRLTDPESWGQNGYDKIITTDDEIKAIRLGVDRDMDGILSRISAGVNFNTREKTKGAAENFLRLPGRNNNNPGTPLPAGATTLNLPGSPSGTVSFDPAAAYPSLYRLDANVNGDILNKGWTVKEEVNTFYLKGDVDTELFGIPVSGNAGLQVVNTDQRSTAPVVDNTNQGTFTLRTDGKSYTDVLPSLNLRFDLGSDLYVRTGIGRQMAKPRMDQLRSFSRSEVNDQRRWTGSGGNAKLDPFRATAFDISAEKYFSGNKGYVSAAAFYKDLKSYIFEFKNTAYDFTGFPNLSGRVPLSNIGEFTQPVNGNGGSIKGIELAASVPLNLLTPMLDGFGVQLSYSDTKSAIRPFGDADVRPLPGLSRKVTQLTAYYEKHGFSARVASRERSAFIAEIEGFGADREFKYARGETLVDLQLGYEFSSGFAKGLSLLVQVNNATNEPYREYDTGSGNDTKLDENGRTILFGVSYKF
jgi:iron complex outermembrane receptor protein